MSLAQAATVIGAMTNNSNQKKSNLINAAGTAANALKGSISDGGSYQSGWSSAKGYSDSFSHVEGNLASERARLNALEANVNARDAWQSAADYNAQQAAINRAWQEYMSNTQYQRAVTDMRKAGINPILAASNGLSSASIGSGATASMAAPETFMGQSIAEQNSASHSENNSESRNSGSSWQHSESGLATGLKLMSDAIQGAMGSLNSANTINLTLDTLKENGLEVAQDIKHVAKETAEAGKKTAEKTVKAVKTTNNKMVKTKKEAKNKANEIVNNAKSYIKKAQKYVKSKVG